MLKSFAFVLLTLLSDYWLTSPAEASQIAIAPYSCRNGFFPGAAQFQLATLHLPVSQKRQYFYADNEGCPTQASCQQKSYLVPGDQVIVAQLQNQWACVWYPGKPHETVGWIPIQSLHFLPLATEFPLTAWQGQWKIANQPGQIAIKVNPSANENTLSLDGEAFWLGAILDSGDQVIHTGTAHASELSPLGSQLHLAEGKSEYDCQMRLTLLPPYLIVHDNRNCGGANVVFDGIYTRN